MGDVVDWPDSGLTEAVGDTQMAHAYAWSNDPEPDEPQRATWPLAWGQAGVMVLVGVAVAVVVGTVGWATMDRDRAPAAIASAAPSPAQAPLLADPSVQVPTPSARGWGTPAATPAELEPDAHDQAFLQALHSARINTDSTSDALFGASWVCGKLRDGWPKADVIVAIKGRNPKLTDMGAIDFVSTAASFYCPQYG